MSLINAAQLALRRLAQTTEPPATLYAHLIHAHHMALPPARACTEERLRREHAEIMEDSPAAVTETCTPFLRTPGEQNRMQRALAGKPPSRPGYRGGDLYDAISATHRPGRKERGDSA
jgi:hypothetical protein